jgi:peroxiredoxin
MKGAIAAAFFATFVLAGTGVAETTPAASPQNVSARNVGEKAPEFSLPASDRRTYSLKDYAGKQAVVIVWFPKAFTPS